jgi:fatty acid desaturase
MSSVTITTSREAAVQDKAEWIILAVAVIVAIVVGSLVTGNFWVNVVVTVVVGIVVYGLCVLACAGSVRAHERPVEGVAADPRSADGRALDTRIRRAVVGNRHQRDRGRGSRRRGLPRRRGAPRTQGLKQTETARTTQADDNRATTTHTPQQRRRVIAVYVAVVFIAGVVGFIGALALDIP